jgi:hypothetical protein
MRNSASFAFRLAGAASVLTMTGLMATSPVQAATSADPIKHFVECAQWLVSDPAKHAKYCDPGHDVFVSGSTGATSVYCPEFSCGEFSG